MGNSIGVDELLAIAVIAGLLLWMWASVLADWLYCWRLRHVTYDFLGRLVITSAVTAIMAALVLQGLGVV